MLRKLPSPILPDGMTSRIGQNVRMDRTQRLAKTGIVNPQIVIVGRLISMTRTEAARAIGLSGGELTERVTRATSMVVLGGHGPQFQRSGREQIQIARARQLIQQGVALNVASEEEWLESIGLSHEAVGIRQRFTAGQMAEALKVPRARLDRWIAAGLVRPVDESAGIPLFDFRQVSAGRTLADLVQSGIRLSMIRLAVMNLGRWLPKVAQPLADLSVGEFARRLVVRMPDGRQAEASGQLLFDFDLPSDVEPIRYTRMETESDVFCRAVSYEQERPRDAAAIYRQLISQQGPHATLAFNLGNALYAAEDIDGARQAFEDATKLKPDHAGAWNNLANVLAELDRPEEACSAYRRAIALNPTDADAHFNLAETLVELGRPDEAVLHWRAYLASDDESVWADYARERLDTERP
jgi:tetratricopeptide (TPR) repeat protein